MKPLLLLHGALASEQQMVPLAEKLSGNFHVHTFSFSGHGGRPLVPERFSMESFSAEVAQYIIASGHERMNVFGYSMGGYATMLSALSEPWLFENIITLGTKFDWDDESAALELRMLDAEKMKQKIPAFAGHLETTHSPTSWVDVVNATRQMIRNLGEKPPLTAQALAFHDAHCLVLCGEHDSTASFESTKFALATHHYAEVLMLPNTPHPFEKVNLELLSEIIFRYCHRS